VLQNWNIFLFSWNKM